MARRPPRAGQPARERAIAGGCVRPAPEELQGVVRADVRAPLRRVVAPREPTQHAQFTGVRSTDVAHVSSVSVAPVGLEPTRQLRQRILNPRRLPFRHGARQRHHSATSSLLSGPSKRPRQNLVFKLRTLPALRPLKGTKLGRMVAPKLGRMVVQAVWYRSRAGGHDGNGLVEGLGWSGRTVLAWG